MISFSTRSLSELSNIQEEASPWEILRQLHLPASYLEFQLLGVPEGQKRRIQVGRGKAIDPHAAHKQRLKWDIGLQIKEKIADEGLDCKNADGYVLSGPVYVELLFFFQPPPSYSKKKTAEAFRNKYYSHKPDVDNATKLVFDVMSGVVFKDDAQIVGGMQMKLYGSEDMTLIRVYPLDAEEVSKLKSPHF